LEEDRVANARVVKENQSLLDTCEELERKRQKVEHDLQAKESYVACLEGQLSHSKQATEAEVLKVKPL
jgi:centromere protein F